MNGDRLPSAPKGIGPRGRRLWRAIVTDNTLDGQHETELLAEACRALDRLDAIRAVLDLDGPMTEGSRGQRVVHPLLAEERRQRDLLSRLLTRIGVPSDDDDGTVEASRLGRRGAQARWYGRHRGRNVA